MTLICSVQLNFEKEFILQAEKLGYSTLILLYTPFEAKKITQNHKQELSSLFQGHIYFAVECTQQKHTQISHMDYFFQLGTRKTALIPRVTHVYKNEYEVEKDFIHQRRAGMNHILLREFAEKYVTLVFVLSAHARILGRIQQNKKLAKKYGVQTLCCQLVTSVSEIRSASDVLSLSHVLE